MRIVVGIPCHESEPGVAATVRELATEVRGLDARLVVCINGPRAGHGPAAAALRGVGDVGVPLSTVALDVASKPAAWERLRREPADIYVFADADVVVEPGSVRALVDALAADPDLAIAAAAQAPLPPMTLPGRVAAVPFRLSFGGVAGTLYAARADALPTAMADVLLDDAWLFAAVGGQVRRVEGAIAYFTPPTTWRDLWRQRRRAEAGKRELQVLGVALAPSPADLSLGGVVRRYRPRELPLVAALAAVKLAARLAARVRPRPGWGHAPSTKRAG